MNINLKLIKYWKIKLEDKKSIKTKKKELKKRCLDA